MANRLRHRGPDDEGYLAVDLGKKIKYELAGDESQIEYPHVETLKEGADLLLGHRRLSILDLSTSGHQPMANHEKSVWVVYNGEIYNYLELRKELEGSGKSFQSNTDTEILLAAYDKWGIDCVHRFNGMWAFVIFDQRKNVLFGSRDRFGVKPLYYYKDSENFAFASEIKALLSLPFVSASVNEKAMFDYLVFNWVENEEEGFFKGIFELPPGSAFLFDLSAGILKIWKYYHLPCSDTYERWYDKKQRNFVQGIRELLYQAVSLRLKSDVPVGSCLSGGIDSSTVVCILNELLKKDSLPQIGETLKVFTALFADKSINEKEWAEEVVRKTGADWYQTFPQPREFAKDLERLVYIQDIPFSSTSIYAQYRVMKLAKESGVKVLLDGQGGDELFAGYPFYYPPFFAEMIKQFDIFSLTREICHIGNAPVRLKKLIMSLFELSGILLMPNLLNETALKIKKEEISYLNPDFWDQYRWRISFLKERVFTSLNRILHEHMTGLNLKSLLRYEDRNSMSFSIEARTPMADDIHLIEYLFQIPPVYKIFHGWSKNLLRQAIRGIVPEKVRWRKDKIGFMTPEGEWLNEMGNVLQRYFTQDLGDFIDVKKVKKDWFRMVQKKKASEVTALWRFVNVAVWKHVFQI